MARTILPLVLQHHRQKPTEAPNNVSFSASHQNFSPLGASDVKQNEVGRQGIPPLSGGLQVVHRPKSIVNIVPLLSELNPKIKL